MLVEIPIAELERNNNLSFFDKRQQQDLKLILERLKKENVNIKSLIIRAIEETDTKDTYNYAFSSMQARNNIIELYIDKNGELEIGYWKDNTSGDSVEQELVFVADIQTAINETTHLIYSIKE